MAAVFAHDLHVHTNLSLCAPRSTELADYLPLCAAEGVRVLGVSNHIYNASFISRPPYGEKSGAARALRLRAEADALSGTAGVRVLLGCEVEVPFGADPNLSPEEAAGFDYVLIAASHVLNLPEYRHFDLDTPEKMRRLLLERFRYACRLSYPVPAGICHPLYPICSPVQAEIVDGISDSELADFFTLAAREGKSIEIHACLYRDGTPLGPDGLSPCYLRVLAAAKACGCRFHFGSDAHAPGAFSGAHRLLYLAAERLGLSEDDLWEVARPGN